MATRLAPARPVITPCTRSQVTRGRSSANSSEGYRPDSMSSTPSNIRRLEIGERRSLPHTGEQVVDVPRLHRRHGDDLLREDVERVARIAGRLRPARRASRGSTAAHASEIAAELREDDAFADGAGLMSGAADALQAAGDRRRRLDLHDEIDGAHVDAELQRGGRDQRADAPGLQQVLDLAAGVARQRAVMRAHERLARQLVERAGQPLRQPAAVHEEQRRPVRANQLEQARMDRGPDRRPHGPCAAGPLGDARRRQPRHVLDRDFDPQRQLSSSRPR